MRDLAARIVAAAGKLGGASRRGANLLFYGAPGTGKSEFAKTLGARVGFSVQFCGETNEANGEPNRRERIAALLIANAIGGVARRTIVVVDEADDLFAGLDDDDGSERRGSKVFMNRLLEGAVAPTIWITNDVDRLGPAIVRRMNLALRFPKPTLSVRRTMVARIARAADFRLDESAALELARSPAPPALIENAIRSAAQIRGSASDAREILDAGLRALGRRRAPTAEAPIPFDPALSSADVDLARLADQVARSREPRALVLPLRPARDGQVGLRPPSRRAPRPRRRGAAVLRPQLDVAGRVGEGDRGGVRGGGGPARLPRPRRGRLAAARSSERPSSRGRSPRSTRC